MKFSTILMTLSASIGLLVFAGCSTKSPAGEPGETTSKAQLEVVEGEDSDGSASSTTSLTVESDGDSARTRLEVIDGDGDGADSAQAKLEVVEDDDSDQAQAKLEVVEGEGDAPARNPEAGDSDTTE